MQPSVLFGGLTRSWPGHHACCTAPMGADDGACPPSHLYNETAESLYVDPNAVLDGNFKVRGVENLRVVDISSWPNVPGWFVTTPTYMVEFDSLPSRAVNSDGFLDIGEGGGCNHCCRRRTENRHGSPKLTKGAKKYWYGTFLSSCSRISRNPKIRRSSCVLWHILNKFAHSEFSSCTFRKF
jgi:hypothetical protein